MARHLLQRFLLTLPSASLSPFPPESSPLTVADILRTAPSEGVLVQND
jgi:hypothetical protein